MIKFFDFWERGFSNLLIMTTKTTILSYGLNLYIKFNNIYIDYALANIRSLK